MDSAIDLTFRYAERDYARALRSHYATRLRLPLDIAVMTGVGGYGVYLLRSPTTHSIGLALVLAAGALAALLLGAFAIVPSVVFRREPKFRDEYSLRFSADGVRFRTVNIDSQLQWAMYPRALITRHSYLLYYGPQQFTVIPKRVFERADQRAQFERLLAQHVPTIVTRGV